MRMFVYNIIKLIYLILYGMVEYEWRTQRTKHWQNERKSFNQPVPPSPRPPLPTQFDAKLLAFAVCNQMIPKTG